MSSCNQHKNPLHHNGTNQAQRLMPGLDKNKFALVDEKDYADWIVFASEFAAYINYYDISDQVTSNWQVFFSSDISVQLGIFALQDIEYYRIGIKERFDYIRNDDNKLSTGSIQRKLNELFSAILTLSKALDESLSKLPKETRLKSTIQNLIQTKLALALKKLLSYHKAAEIKGYLDHAFLNSLKILNKPLIEAIQIIYEDGLSTDWLCDTKKDKWDDYISEIIEDDSIYNNPLDGFTDDIEHAYLSIEHAANHNLFTGIFDIYLSSYTKIIKDAEIELLKSLENYDAHPAHYTLFLSFLKLFRFAQTHINTITQRHLDFYYKEVLKLQPRTAEANKVHIIGELAKQVDDYLLTAGSPLKAGKDSLNNEVIYSLDADTIFNKANVAQLKTFYKGSKEDNIYYTGTSNIKQNNEGRVFASPVANSEDGLGAELNGNNKEWHPFVHKIYSEAALDCVAMPKAQLGFALASHYLYLTEGERKVNIRLVTNPSSALDGKKIECWLTMEKEWYNVANPVILSAGKLLSDGVTACTEISFTIPGTVPAIVNYNAAIHGGTYNCALPILKVYLVHEDSSVYDYDSLKDTMVAKIEINVNVGMDDGFNQKGLKNLLLSNDFGALDASKPFMPFGGQSKKDAGFVIGHKEIFSKKNASIKLNIEWADLPDNVKKVKYDLNNSDTISNDKDDVPKVKAEFLERGIWTPLDEGSSNLSIIERLSSAESGLNSKIQISISNQVTPADCIVSYQDEYLNHNSQSLNGFLRLSLNSGFGYSDYIKDLSVSLIEKAPGVTKTISNTLIVEPYTPKIKSLYASYSTFCNNDINDPSEFSTREIYFFHIYPFGEGEQHKYIQPDTDVYLFPQFKHTVKGDKKQHIGEFYVGIKKNNPGEAVNILFQVLEGTTDPGLAKPPDHIHWSYLSNNQWIVFESNEYSDNTLDLVQSGIISFAVPKQATSENSVLPAGLIWMRAAVTEAAETVCKLLSVDTQAAVATFSNNNNAEDFLNFPLAAGTISKLKSPAAEIKKIRQPYPAFGGRKKESDDHFYIRVSERLRHKVRAITVWDYEHLVLEEFPEIYKVKCLNHTQIEGNIYNEIKPGYVSIITIPILQNRNDVNPLKPYTQQSTLTRIENYLSKLIPGHLILKACQPQFEEVRLTFSLKLREEYKDFTFYSNKLKEEITRFLSPWAYGNQSSLDFGGKIYKSVLINFIEERYYVDFITDVFMYVKVNDQTAESNDSDEIIASTARSILVSVPDSRHIIN